MKGKEIQVKVVEGHARDDDVPIMETLTGKERNDGCP